MNPTQALIIKRWGGAAVDQDAKQNPFIKEMGPKDINHASC